MTVPPTEPGIAFGICAFRLRRPFQTDGFIGLIGIGSRFIAGERYMTAQVLARSTRLNSRLPGGTELQNSLGRVDIPVMHGPAVRTGPHSNRQRHFLLVASAVATGLATGKRVWKAWRVLCSLKQAKASWRVMQDAAQTKPKNRRG